MRHPRRFAAAACVAGLTALCCILAVSADATSTATPTPDATPASSATPAAPSPYPGGIQFGPGAPTPAPLPAPQNGPSVDGSSDSPGFFDIGGHIREAIDDWFRGLVTSALNPLLDLLGRSVLSTPDVSGSARVRELWGVSAGIADSLLVMLVLAGGALVMSHETLQTRYSAKEIAPRIVAAAIAANASLAMSGIAIRFCDALSQTFLGQGVDPANATATIHDLVTAALASGGIFLILMGGVVMVLALMLLCIYVIRVALIILLVAAAPVALVCHALPQTDGLAQWWWRSLFACLLVQVGQSLVLITALRVFFASDGHAALGLASGGGLIDVVLAGCLLWVLVRIPTWTSRAVFSRSGHGSGFASRAVKTAVVIKIVRGLAAAL